MHQNSNNLIIANVKLIGGGRGGHENSAARIGKLSKRENNNNNHHAHKIDKTWVFLEFLYYCLILFNLLNLFN